MDEFGSGDFDVIEVPDADDVGSDTGDYDVFAAEDGLDADIDGVNVSCEVFDMTGDGFDVANSSDANDLLNSETEADLDMTQDDTLSLEDCDVDDIQLSETAEADSSLLETEEAAETDEMLPEDDNPSGENSEGQELAEQTGEIDYNEWLHEINPNYDPFDLSSAYNNNCGSCAYAVNQRIEGNTDIVATSENIGTPAEMNKITGMEQVAMRPEEIRDYLISQGPGAHGIVGIDRVSGPGHWFNAYYDGNKVVAIDGQTGETHDWPPDYGDVTNWDISVKKDERK